MSHFIPSLSIALLRRIPTPSVAKWGSPVGLGMMLALCLWFVMPAPGTAQEPMTQEQTILFEQAQDRLRQGDVPGAISIYQTIDQSSGGTSIDALFGLGNAYFGLEKYKKSADVAERILELADQQNLTHPNIRPASFKLLGFSLLHLAKKDQDTLRLAESALRQSIALQDGTAEEQRYGLALVLKKLGREQEALETYAPLLRAKEIKVADEARIAYCELSHSLRQDESGLETPSSDTGPSPHLTLGDPINLQDSSRSEGVQKPRKIYAPQPSPGLPAPEGSVVIQAIIDQNGCVTSAKILSGIPEVNETVLETVQRWVFRPATLNELPVIVFYSLTVNFRRG